MPGSRLFFDANVLLYLASGDEQKAKIAEELLLGGGTISVQVLNEIANVSRRKMRRSWLQTHDFLRPIRSLLKVVPVTIAVHESGLSLAERYNFSVYDAMIVAAALDSNCDFLLSEDMQHGMRVDDRLRIENPFLA